MVCILIANLALMLSYFFSAYILSISTLSFLKILLHYMYL